MKSRNGDTVRKLAIAVSTLMGTAAVPVEKLSLALKDMASESTDPCGYAAVRLHLMAAYNAALVAAKDPDGPGGETITPAEADDLKKIAEATQHLLAAEILNLRRIADGT